MLAISDFCVEIPQEDFGCVPASEFKPFFCHGIVTLCCITDMDACGPSLWTQPSVSPL